MTICLALTLKDKVILASDSAVRISCTIPDKSYTSYHGQKLFEFANNIGCLHFGAGRIGKKPIAEIIQEFKDNNDIPTDNLPFFITIFMNFIRDKLIQFPTTDYIMGFYFVKIDENQTPVSYKIQITGYINDTGEYIIDGPIPTPYFCPPHIICFGDIEFTNIYLNTPSVYKSLVNNNKNLNEFQINCFIDIMDKCNESEEFLDVSEDKATKFVDLLMKTIIKSTNEYRKIDVVGEPIDIAVVSKDDFKWIQRKTSK